MVSKGNLLVVGVVVCLIIFSMVMFYFSSSTPPTIRGESCENATQTAENYLLPGEDLRLFVEYKASSAYGLRKSSYCLFEVTHSKKNSQLIPINLNRKERVRSNDTIEGLALAYYTSKWVTAEQNNLSIGLERAHRNVKAADYGQNVQKRMGELALEGADHLTIKYSKFNIDGGKPANLAKDLTCGSRYECTDWDRFDTQMSELRTRTTDFEHPETLYEDDILTYLPGLVNTQKVLESVDREFSLHLSSSLDSYDFDSRAERIRNKSSEEPRRLNNRVKYLESSLEEEKEDVNDKLENISDTLHTARNKGKPVGDLHDEYCDAKNKLPDGSLLDRENFSAYRGQLKEVKQSRIYGIQSSDYDPAPTGFFKKQIASMYGSIDTTLFWNCW